MSVDRPESDLALGIICCNLVGRHAILLEITGGGRKVEEFNHVCRISSINQS